MMMPHWLIVCIQCYMHLTFVFNCPFMLYYSPYKITVMIECITMNWDQCRDIKYDTITVMIEYITMNRDQCRDIKYDTITVMIECITMNWDQCRDIKYDTITVMIEYITMNWDQWRDIKYDTITVMIEYITMNRDKNANRCLTLKKHNTAKPALNLYITNHYL